MLIKMAFILSFTAINFAYAQLADPKLQSERMIEVPLHIPTDAKAKYFVIGKEGTPQNPILITKRIGPSGTSFSKRVFDCEMRQTKYLGDGETQKDMNESKPEPSMYSLLPESIAWFQFKYACQI